MVNANKVGLASALTLSLLYIVCLVFALTLPALYLFGVSNFIHINITGLSTANITFVSSVLGLVISIAIGWLFGYLTVSIYNKL